MCIAVQCNTHCNTHCNAKIKHIIPKFYSRAVILLRSSFAMVYIIPKILVFSYVILLRSSALQCKLQRTLMTSFQKIAPEQCSAIQTAMHSDDIIPKFLLRSSAMHWKLQRTLLLGMNSIIVTTIIIIHNHHHHVKVKLLSSLSSQSEVFSQLLTQNQFVLHHYSFIITIMLD